MKGYDTPFQNRMSAFDATPGTYDPFSAIKTEGLRISDSFRNRLLFCGERHLYRPYEPISAQSFMRFVSTGDRSAFEKIYFSRRCRLCDLVVAELAGHSDDLTADITDGIYFICEESSWVLPAHNTYVRDTPQLILPDTTRPVLDLFACETAALLAMTYYLLKDRLDAVSDLICKRIQNEISRRLITPYLNDHFWWMGNEDEPMCNWTPWCTQNVLLSVFLLPNDDDTRLKVIKQAAYSLDCFLKDYGEDGCCDEGAQYYRHAGLCLFHCIDILNRVTSGAFDDLWDMTKIKNIASYIVNVRVGGGYYVNFSDCSARLKGMGVREFLFGKACRLDALMEAAAQDLYDNRDSIDVYDDDSTRMNLYYRMLDVAYTDEAIRFYKDKPQKSDKAVADIFYPSVGLMVARSSRFVLAVKAGDNADNHNHNDTGSFTLYMEDKPLFADIGVETYSRKTFSDDRYDIWTMQSAYHNLPTICGTDQCAGRQYRATCVNCRLEDEKKTISMHIERAYPLPDKLSYDTTYIRSLTLDAAAERVTLTDTTKIPDVILNFITYEPIKPTEDKNIYRLGEALISVTGASFLAAERLPITDARLKKAWDHDLYRIRFKKEAGEVIMQIN